MDASKLMVNLRVSLNEDAIDGVLSVIAAAIHRAEKAEAERDAWRNRCNAADAEYSDLVRERDELRVQLAQRQQAEQRMGDWLERELNSDEEAQP